MLGVLVPLAGLLGLEVEGMGRRVKVLIAVYAAIALLAGIGTCFLIAAGYIALSELLGLLPATLVMAGIFLVLALLIYLGFAIAESRRRKHLAEKRRAADAGTFITTAALAALPLLARSPLVARLGLPAAAITALAMLRDKHTPSK